MAEFKSGRRYYQADTPLEPPISTPHPNAIMHLRQQEGLSMIEIFHIEKFLRDGKRPKRSQYVGVKDRNRIVEEYNLVYDPSKRRFSGNENAVWSILCNKYPVSTQKYAGYKECQYALKYGAQPCNWASA